MESRILKALVVLGVPGVALGVLLLKGFGFRFSEIGPAWAAGDCISPVGAAALIRSDGQFADRLQKIFEISLVS